MAGPKTPPIAASIHALIDSLRDWLGSFVHLAALEAQQAGAGVMQMLLLGIGASVLLVTGWLALVACAVALLVENGILGWAWSFLIAALLSFCGAGGLVFVVIRRSRHPLFSATRRQLGLKSASATNHE